MEYPVFLLFIDPNFDHAISTQKSFLAWQSKHYASLYTLLLLLLLHDYTIIIDTALY